MSQRYATLHVGELELELLAEGLYREAERLKGHAALARDAVDRDAWAAWTLKARAVQGFATSLKMERLMLGEVSPEVLEEFQSRVVRWRRKMPRSAANAEALRAEREGRK